MEQVTLSADWKVVGVGVKKIVPWVIEENVAE